MLEADIVHCENAENMTTVNDPSEGLQTQCLIAAVDAHPETRQQDESEPPSLKRKIEDNASGASSVHDQNLQGISAACNFSGQSQKVSKKPLTSTATLQMCKLQLLPSFIASLCETV